MNRFRLYVATAALLGISGYLAYQLYFPVMVANSITSESTFLVPEKMQTRIKKIKTPVNDGAKTVVETMHRNGVTMDQVLEAIDNAQEEQALALLDELNSAEVTTPDQFFDLCKKHFPVQFDVEVFREPFKEKVGIELIRKGIKYANAYRERDELDAATAKSIAKRILLQKEAEFNRIVKNN